MKVCQVLLDERIDDNTTVIIKDKYGEPLVCGRWYQDKILTWGKYRVSFDFVTNRNIAVLQLL